MNNKTVVINSESKKKSKNNININWQPIRDGDAFKKYLDLNKKISDEDKLNLTSDSLNLLGQAVDPQNIKKVGLDSTGLCFGQIQSGKTTSMEAVSALAADNKYKIIILLTGNVTPLTSQNTGRVDRALQGREWLVIKNTPDEPWNRSENTNQLKNIISGWFNANRSIVDTFSKTVLILSMKNPSKIKRITKLFTEASSWNTSVYDKIPTLIIDDEADHHSLNSSASKNDPDEKDEDELYTVQNNENWKDIAEKFDVSVRLLKEANPDFTDDDELSPGDQICIEYRDIRTHEAIRNLRSLFNFHSFLGYTATPNANLLINTINHLSPSFSQILLPGKDYTGLEFFFSRQEYVDKYVSNIESKIRELEDSNERPKSLEDAFMHFIVSVACGYIDGDHNKDNKNRSMIIHPDRELESHDQYINWINGLKVKWVNELRADKNSDEYVELTKEIKNTLENIRNNANNKNKIPNFSDDFIDYFKEALQNIIPTEFNAGRGRRRRRIPIIPWDRSYANLLIGGQGLDRGYTVEGLVVTYLSRAAGTRQQDTILQRARFLGYHKKNIDFVKIFLTDALSDFFMDTYNSDRELRNSLERHSETGSNLKDWHRVWISRNIGNYRLTRSTIINSYRLVSRNEPPPAARTAYSWKMSEEDINFNREIYSNLKDKYNNQLQPVNSITEITNLHSWAKREKFLIAKEVTLRSIYENVLSKLKHEPRDVRSFAIVERIIHQYLYSGAGTTANLEELICPIIFMEGRKERSPSKDKKVLDRIQTAQGPDQELKNNPGDRNLFPGDRIIHYEYLIGQNNDQIPNHFPTLQIYNYNITPQLGHKGEPLAKDIPFFNFYMPRESWTDIIMGIKRSDINR